MKKTTQRLSNQYLGYLLMLAVILFIGLNLIVNQIKVKSYTTSIQQQAETLLEVIALKSELPLLIAHTEQINDNLDEMAQIGAINYIKIRNNQGVLVVERSFSTSESSDESLVFHKVIQQKPQSSSIDFFADELTASESSREIGSIELSMQKTSASISKSTDFSQLMANLFLAIMLVITWIVIYNKQRKNARDLKTIESLLKNTLLQNGKKMETLNAQSLYLTAKKVNAIGAKRTAQLQSLEREVKDAREDGNVELHNFIRFLKQFGAENYQQELELFYSAVLSRIHQQKSVVDVTKLVKRVITKYSETSQQQNLVVLDNYLGIAAEKKVLLDEQLFYEFFDLFFSQLILLCSNAELTINIDLNQGQSNSAILRISIESDCKNFISAIERQSFFDFDHSQEITSSKNNISLVASKHLLKKSGGDFYYLENELRFEFPVNTQEALSSSSHTALVSPFENSIDALVYDSDAVDRLVLMGYLEKFNIQVDKATTKQVVLQKIRRQSFQLLCVNSEFFTEQDPYFLKNFASEYSELSNKPKIIVISSRNEIQQNPEFKMFGASFLQKPLDLMQLRELLVEVEDKSDS